MQCMHCKMQEEILVSTKVPRSEICDRGEKLSFAVYHCTDGCAFEHCFLEFQALSDEGPLQISIFILQS